MSDNESSKHSARFGIDRAPLLPTYGYGLSQQTVASQSMQTARYPLAVIYSVEESPIEEVEDAVHFVNRVLFGSKSGLIRVEGSRRREVPDLQRYSRDMPARMCPRISFLRY